MGCYFLWSEIITQWHTSGGSKDGSIQIEVPGNHRGAQGVHVRGAVRCPTSAFRTAQVVFLQSRQLGFVHNHSKVVPFQIVIGNVVHISIVDGRAGILKTILFGTFGIPPTPTSRFLIA
jgi:hypothetical protein